MTERTTRPPSGKPRRSIPPRRAAKPPARRARGSRRALSLEALAELFTAIVNSALDAVVVCDEAQNVVLMNAAAEQVFGWSSGEALGRPLSRFVPERFRERHEELVRELGASGASRRAHAEFSPVIGLSASGEEIPLEASIASVEVGGRKYFTVLHRDVRKRLSADAAVQASERRFRGLFESLLEGYAYCRMEFDEGRAVDYVHLEVNPAFEALTGLRGASGRRVTELIPGIREDNPELFEIYGRVVATGEPAKFDTFVPGLDRWYSIAAFRPEEGCFAVVFENVTEAKRSLLALRESERFANTVLDGLAANIAVVDERGEILAVNQAWRLFGETNGLSVDNDPAAYGNYFQVCDQASARGAATAAEFAAGLRGVLTGVLPHFELEYDCHSPDEQRWFLARVTPTVEKGSRRAIIAHENITERRRAESGLRANEERLRLALEGANQGLYDLNLATGEAAVSHEYVSMLGYDPATFHETNQAWIERLHPDDRDRVAAVYRDYIAGRLPEYRVEFRQRTADGSWKWILSLGRVVERDADGRPRRMLGTHTDLTERKLAEEALAAERSRLRTVLDTIPDPVWLKDPNGVFLACNPAFERMIGLPEARLVGLTDDVVVPREQALAFRERDHLAIAAGRPTVNEEWLTFADDGHLALLETTKTPMRDHHGELLGVLGIAREVTETRRTAEALRQSEERYRALAETTFDWIWEVDESGRFTFASPRVTELLGFTPEEVVGRSPFDLMPESEAARVRGTLEAQMSLRQPVVALENVNRHRDGRLVVLETSAVPIFGPGGEFRGYRGMDRDITARKQAVRRLATQGEVSRVLAEFDSLAGAAGQLLAAIGRSEDWQFGAYWDVERERAELRCVEIWNAAGPTAEAFGRETRRLVLRRGEGLPGRVWAAASPMLFTSLPDDERFLRKQAAAEAGLRSAIALPIVGGEDVLGVVEFMSLEIHEPEPGLLEMFETIGRQLGQFVERRRAEEAVKRFVAGSPAVIYALRVEREALKLTWYGGNLETISGWPADRIRGAAWWVDNVHPVDRERVLAANSLPYEIDHQILEFRFRRPDGNYTWVRDEKRLLRDAQGRPTEVVGSWTDVTERVQLEEQLRVSQKLEAVGQLAGGVAHDFNNILTVIAGNSELLAKSLAPAGGDQVLLGEIRDASERAAALTRQLLAFSRSQVLAPRVLEINDVVRRVEGMLRRLIGEDIALVCDLAPDAGFVMVDPGQIEQVIVNLAVNSRDAMPRGGKLTIESHAVELDEDYCRRHPEVPPGRYALLAVSDTGTGMTPEVRARIFEPFFTTKGPGKGSGLGLATVFGIVKQSGGQIEADSEVGSGTSFRVYLPRLEAPAATTEEDVPVAKPVRGHETILLVEDEEGVRKIARLALEGHGYRVLGATDGRAAVAVAEEHGKAIDLVVTDLVMPEMSGRELADLLRSRRPDLKVLFMSGYVEDAIVRHGLVQADEAFLHKPFSLGELAARVRDLLDSTPKPSA